METYSKLVIESSKNLYYLETTGRFYKIEKGAEVKKGVQRRTTGTNIEPRLLYKSKQDKKGTLYIATNVEGLKRVALHSLMARTFMRGYDPKKHCVGHKDGDPSNCRLDNLYLYSRRKHASMTAWKARSQGVIIKEFKKDPVEYRSVREAAKALYCSYQTLLDYLTGASQRSVITARGRKVCYVGETFEDAEKRRKKGINGGNKKCIKHA